MKKLNQFLTEAKMRPPGRFKNSQEATDYIVQLESLLDSSSLVSYVKMTDKEFGTRTHEQLIRAQEAYYRFLYDFMQAGSE